MPLGLQHPTRLRFPALIPAASVTALLFAAGQAAAQFDAPAGDPGMDLAGVETESAMEAGPGDIPGRITGPRQKPPVEAPAPEPAPAPAAELREWFGGKPWREWSRATGDWAGGRTWLENAGLTISASFRYDWSSVWSGGLRNVASTRSLFDLNAAFDTEKMLGLPGGTFYLDFQSTDVRGGSRDIGDIQGYDSIDSGENIHQLSEVWYEQTFFESFLRVKVGKIDANTEFDSLQCTGHFMHSAAGPSPATFSMPTYPNSAFGALAFIYPTENTYVGAGFFDGSGAEGVKTGGLGPAPLFHGNEYYFIAEAGLSWKPLGGEGGLGRGRCAAGGWYNTATFEEFDGSGKRGACGPYIVLEQQLLARDGSDDDEKGLFAFARFAHADGDVAAITNHFSCGLALHGTFAGRDDDAAGALLSFADLSGNDAAGFSRDETAIECFYRCAATRCISITGDLQIIVNPGGASDVDTAVVGALRMDIAF